MSDEAAKGVCLTDRWTTEDALNFSDFRSALQTILHTAETPLTVGVFGPWGSGKTSLMRMLRQKLEGSPGDTIRTVWFTAWKYSGGPSSCGFSTPSTPASRVRGCPRTGR
jgi:predicted KAP-like P-loop ATPase